MIMEPAAEQALMAWSFVQESIRKGASDLHFCVGSPPIARIHGQLFNDPSPPITADQMKTMVELLTDRQTRSEFYSERPVDIDYTVEMPSFKRRMRVNIFRQYQGPSIVMRVLADSISSFDELGLPKAFEKLAFERSGLLLVTGGTGSGKSTTLASMIELINRRQRRHIITIEDPIEIVFTNQQALVEQRQVGTHVADFHVALRSALREAPDVILVGEIRDSDTGAMTLRAAQVGALVMATLHTRSAAETVSRYLSLFEDNWRAGARQQLADVLRGVLCQNLVLGKKGDRRYAACEVLIGTLAARNLVREDRMHLLHSVMEISAGEGMLTMEQSLHDLYKSGKIDLQTAYDTCNDKTIFLTHLEPLELRQLQIPQETEVELKNLEKAREARVRQLSSKS